MQNSDKVDTEKVAVGEHLQVQPRRPAPQTANDEGQRSLPLLGWGAHVSGIENASAIRSSSTLK